MIRRIQAKGTIKIGKKRSGTIWMRKSTLSVIFSLLTTVFITISLTMAGVPVIWMAWYRLSPGTSERLAFILQKPVVGFEEQLVEAGVKPETPWLPPLDPSLPTTPWVTIPAMGVNTQIIEAPTDKYEDALKQGVWRIPDSGTPENRQRTMIVGAHRFGYLKWSNLYRREHSFYNITRLKVGDKVEVRWGQRKYTYEIYAQGEGTQITDYTANLILYTCKFLESDVRIFRYGRLIEQG